MYAIRSYYESMNIGTIKYLTMKFFNIIVLTILVVSCSSGKISEVEQISLNGVWKFHAIYGEGSNYMNILETDSDIVMDNDDPHVKVKGDWEIVKPTERNSKFYGKDYLHHNFTLTNLVGGNKNDTSYVRYCPGYKRTGYYEVFTRFPFASHLTAQYNINHANVITSYSIHYTKLYEFR